MQKLLIFIVSLILASCAQNEKKELVKASEASAKSTFDKSIVEKNVEVKKPESDSEIISSQAGSESLPALEGKSVENYNCVFGSDIRKVDLVERTDVKGWGVVYTKWGQTKTVAIANNQKEYCTEIFERIKTKLTSSGFNCADKTAQKGYLPSLNYVDEMKRNENGLIKTSLDRAKDILREGAGAIIDRTSDSSPQIDLKQKVTQ